MSGFADGGGGGTGEKTSQSSLTPAAEEITNVSPTLPLMCYNL